MRIEGVRDGSRSSGAEATTGAGARAAALASLLPGHWVSKPVRVAMSDDDWRRFDNAIGLYGRFAGQIFAPAQGGVYRTEKIVHTIDVENAIQIYLVKENKEVILTTGYDFVLHLKNDYNKQENKIEGVNVKLEKTSTSKNKENINQLSVEFGKEPKFVFNLQPQIVQLYKQYTLGKFKKDTIYNNYYLPNDVLKFVKSSKNHTFNLVITRLNFNLVKSKSDFSWLSFEGYLLIKKN